MTTIVLTSAVTRGVVFAARGGYHPHGGGGVFAGLLATFVHAAVWAFGWRAGESLAEQIPGKVLAFLLVVGICAYLWSARRTRRRGRR